MQKIYEFLMQAGTYYLATCENGQPRVRPFGTIHIYKDKLYIQTGKIKAVSRQLHVNPKLEICAMFGDRWLRLEATAVEDTDRAAVVSMLDAFPTLQTMYAPDDGNVEVWYLRNVTATFYSMTEAPKSYKL